ncbi:MAG: MerR family DNA-binding transcriptional regulator, partial [Thermaerobacter sp.]|nr:MerR family DNA-binding transcriptional regulator [Thermaerobacter sp.]
MSKLVSVAEAAKFLGVSKSTLRRWEREGRLLP